MDNRLIALTRKDDVIGLKDALSNQGDLLLSDAAGEYALLREAAGSGATGVISFLLSLGHPVDVADVHGPSAPLRNAIAFGHLAAVKLLAQSGANIHAPDNLGPNMPIRVAIFNRRHAIASWLIKEGVKASAPECDGCCIELREARETGDKAMIDIISEWVETAAA